jgi:F0F1-type ATP synthase assembly protein I
LDYTGARECADTRACPAAARQGEGGRLARVIGEMAKKNRSFSYSRSAKSLQQNASNAGSAAGASYTLVGAILVLGGIGYGIDRWQGTSPWGLIIGLTLGVIVGFYDLVKSTLRR